MTDPKPVTQGIKATYPGRCLRCGKHYPAGTLLRKFAQGWACCK